VGKTAEKTDVITITKEKGWIQISVKVNVDPKTPSL
jgi:hypothetical protein